MNEIVSFQDKKEYCLMLSKSGLLPADFKGRAENVLIAMEFGNALGISPIVAMNQIYVVKGKPTLSANLMSALIMGSGKGTFSVEVETNKEVTITGNRYGLNGRADTKYTSTFTIEDAKQAGLTNNDTWKKYTKDMLFSKALGRLARRLFGDVCSGFYVQGELDGEEAPSITGNQDFTQAKPQPTGMKVDKKETITPEYEEVSEVYEVKYKEPHDVPIAMVAMIQGLTDITQLGKLSNNLQATGTVVMKEPGLRAFFRAKSNAINGSGPTIVEGTEHDMAIGSDDELPY